MSLHYLVKCQFLKQQLKAGNSLDNLRHIRSVAYSVELVLLNKHQICGGAPKLNCYLEKIYQTKTLYYILSSSNEFARFLQIYRALFQRYKRINEAQRECRFVLLVGSLFSRVASSTLLFTDGVESQPFLPNATRFIRCTATAC